MASYRGHLALSAPLGVGYGCLTLLRPEFDWGPLVVGTGLTTLGGLLPDLDSDSGVPVRELFGITAAVVAAVRLQPLRDNGLAMEQCLAILGGVYLFIRYAVSSLFGRFTVHRGMFHSVPAMLIAGLVVYLLYPGADLYLRLYLAGGVMVGFLSHLILDEIYSVDFSGVAVKFKKSAGSALKFGSQSWVATMTCYLILGGLGWLAWEGGLDRVRWPGNVPRPSWLTFDDVANSNPGQR